MNKIYTILFCLIASFQLIGQVCMPVELASDTTIVFPDTYNSETMTGGLAEACINSEYEFVLTIKIPDAFDLNGTNVAIDSASIGVMDAIAGLPSGIDYACNPPDCVFEALVPGCIQLSGTPDDTNEIRDYEMSLVLDVYTFFPTPFVINYPEDLNLPGAYFITVNEENSPECMVSSISSLASEVRLSANPNPLSNYTEINIQSVVSKEIQFSIKDALGRSFLHRNVSLNVGNNTIPFNAENLEAGMYIYMISDGKNILSEKMLVIK